MGKVKNILLLLVLLLNGLVQAQNTVDRARVIRRALLERNSDHVFVVTHRGDWRNYPENSISAIKSAIQMGADIVELDVQRTKDGVLILMHDKTLDRTTTGSGLVKDTEFNTIQTMYLKNGAAIRTKEKVPTLEEALIVSKGKVLLNLDKADDYFDEIYELLKKTGMSHQIIMKGNRSATEVKEKYGSYLTDILYMPIVDLDKPNALTSVAQFLTEINPVAIEFVFSDKKNTKVTTLPKLLENKSLIWYNTLWDTLSGGNDDDSALANPDAIYGYLINQLHARIIQTDRPIFLIDYLKKIGKH
ncbi:MULTISPECIES: glycerophosphodiester phosphodiesterase family protein [Sphingobacterium]|uniref:Glycerophosphodiester phosphodiesterase n=1 Tax=Sphingobacterium multivorum TaxID=28454 RepID=A0A653YT22_SPHMU|nr:MULTISPECIES: glycerophosphodiester phosphodiesterase family protein [Sphingobacterium]QQT47237.1 glycerophosphodiester phosphodiesterase family protein [Sphingobacterium multivorum]SUJ12867.1 Glycerophosphoryl diester phosphodiesterase [Sphingobacterium multivorum]VXC45732.1 Glycerophosphodiester phosphodiesterase [Sphingobacterium multivorum]HBI87307.1 glycerophosphodiester phosphodiesterase [Sphingobacterium sp.]